MRPLRITFGLIAGLQFLGIPTAIAQPPAPAPACAGMDFIVYYQWDTTKVAAGGDEIIVQALDSARANLKRGCRIKSIFVTGHADSSEVAIGDGDRIALARAQAAVGIFNQVGVPPSVTHAEGKPTDYAVLTLPNVREPVNRNSRISVTYH